MSDARRVGGFAVMNRDEQRQIASKGGVAAHEQGKAHEFTSEEARNAGRKGGQMVSSNKAHMIEIGRLGGRKSAEARRARSMRFQPKQSDPPRAA